MKQTTTIDISEFRKDRPLLILFSAPRHPTFRLITLVFCLAGATHLGLADAWQASWLPGNILFGLGLLLLLFRPGALGFGLVALGKLLPLLFARDHLVQSLLMLLFGLGGMIFIAFDAYWRSWPKRTPYVETSYGRITVYLESFFATLKFLTITTYGLAAFHKVNRDFFDPEVSCANHGLNRVLDYYGIAPLEFGSGTLYLALFVIALEASIALLYLLGRRKEALIAALVFHIPLTLTMAPAFAFVMLIGHAAFLRPRDLKSIKETIWNRGFLVFSVAITLTTISVLFEQKMHDSTMPPRELLLWALLLLLLFSPAFPKVTRFLEDSPFPVSRRSPSWPSYLALFFGAAFLVQGLLPYTGLRFQHTGAMVSNLRIDEGCWNHLLVPESFRIEDRYIRVDEVYFGAPGRIPRYEGIVRDQLWNGPMVRQMQTNWCRRETRPFYLAGTFRNRSFEIEDLCAEDLPWPFYDDGLFGRELFPEHLLFQRNLHRECPQRCMH